MRSPKPLYEQISIDLERRIRSGEIRYMERLPSLPQICKRYGVSMITARRALDELARAGLVTKQPGRGRGTLVVRRFLQVEIRVLLIAGFNIYKSPIETSHEVFDILSGIQKAAEMNDCPVQVVSPDGFDSLPHPRGNVGYVILAMTWAEYQHGVALASMHEVPYILVNPPQSGVPCVRVDMEQGAFIGVNYLAQLGHRRIAYVGPTSSQWFAPRFAGYQRALEENNIRLDRNLVLETNGVDAEEDYRALDTFLSLPEPPTAIFAASDYRALHLLSRCKQKGIRVPHDVSICGYDNIRESAAVEPALTTVHHPREELGRLAVEHLLHLINGDCRRSIDVIVEPRLVTRGSTGVPRR